MDRRATILLVALSTLGLFGFTGGGCFPSFEPDDPPEDRPCILPATADGRCPEPAACFGLDEASCNADPSCQAIYAGGGDACVCGPCPDDGSDCFCGCPEPEPPGFVRCDDRTEPVCPEVMCDLYCEYGFATGRDGCPTCSCVPPPPQRCEGLDEAACVATPGCRAEYVGWGCACACDSDGNCPPCDCPEPPSGEEFTGCVTADPCNGLDEQSCQMTPGCSPLYASDPCPMMPCRDDGTECPVCDASVRFQECITGGIGGCTSDAECPAGTYCLYESWDCACPACYGDGCEPCACPPPPSGGQCVPVEPGCSSNDECPPGFVCEWGAYDCYCPPCADDGSECAQCDCPATSQCVPATTGCESDADCGPGGYCENLTMCPSADCGGGICVYPACGDGSQLACRMVEPTCAPGEIAAVFDGCWVCVDARSCQEPCWGAWVDETGTCRAPNDGLYPQECCGPVDCVQVVTYAADPRTGECFAFATPCDVPEGWASCR